MGGVLRLLGVARSMMAAVVVLVSVGRAEGVDYEGMVKPLLEARCYACHGALKQEAGLRLDTVAMIRQGGKSGAVVVPGDVAGSRLIERVMTEDLNERMPPEHEGEPFRIEEVELLRRWIVEGAVGPAEEQPEADPRDHWAYRPVVRPNVPEVSGQWGTNPIDAFVASRHQTHGLMPPAAATAGERLRRVYFDLIGLPPSEEEWASVLGVPSGDWYEAVVDRLLADPAYGERWGRHWMDVWRYSDWWGLGDQLRNSQKHLWHWRDWIIESLNADLSYAEMVRLMLAADELHPGDLSKLRATGFLARNYFIFNRNPWMEEAVEHVGKSLLGLTLNCAKCHDHKYDPVDQKDYYRMRAFFEPYHVRLDMVPGEIDLERDGVPRVFDGWLEAPTWRYIRGEESRPDQSVSLAPGVPALLAFRPLEISPVDLPVVAWQPERQPWVIEAHRAAAENRVAEAARALQEHTAGMPRETLSAEQEANVRVAELALVVAEARRGSVEARALAMRASWGEGGEATAAAKAAVRAERVVAQAAARHAVAEKERTVRQSPPEKKEEAEKELAAAHATLAAAEAALDEPVGEGDGFAKLAGGRWTPTRFLDSTRDDPEVGFPSRSTGRRTALADWITDPRHPLTARVAVNHIWTRHFGTPLVATVFDFGRKGTPPTHPELLDWLAAELVENNWSMKHLHRLMVTSATYQMTSSMAGAEAAATLDPDNRLLWRRLPQRLEAEVIRDAILEHGGQLDRTRGGPPVPPGFQDDSNRRSLYFYHSNNDRNLFLTTFDGAGVKECYLREQSIVPQQALALSNSRLAQEAARTIADRLAARRPAEADPAPEEAFIRRSWLELLGRAPNAAEEAACRAAVNEWRQLTPDDPGAARAHLIWTLLNHHDFLTIR